jgi:RNA polymerase sigma-70 factor, ECF subfamily
MMKDFSPDDDPDVQKMLAFQTGEASAFDDLLRTHFRKVMNFIFRYTRDSALAEDLTQEVFLRIYRSAPGYRPRAKFQTWMFTIARNLALNALRRQSRRDVSMDQEYPGEEGFRKQQWIDERAPLPSEALLKQEREALIQEALDQLPEHQRAAVLLRRYENMPYEDIAQTLGVTVPAVKSLLTRARETLKAKLKPFL